MEITDIKIVTKIVKKLKWNEREAKTSDERVQ